MTRSAAGHIQRYGRRDEPNYPSDLDVVVVTNEDLGLGALTIATLNVLETTIPYPQEWDPDRDVCILRKILFYSRLQEHQHNAEGSAYGVNMSFLDRSPAATYVGAGSDAEDEYHKSIFQGPMYYGNTGFQQTASANTQLYNHSLIGTTQIAEYIPEIPLSMFFPIYLDIWGNSATYVLADGLETAVDTNAQENHEIRYFYNIRRQNRAENDFLNSVSGVTVRWAQLGS